MNHDFELQQKKEDERYEKMNEDLENFKVQIQ
jgi:hypothetical protein